MQVSNCQWYSKKIIEDNKVRSDTKQYESNRDNGKEIGNNAVKCETFI